MAIAATVNPGQPQQLCSKEASREGSGVSYNSNYPFTGATGVALLSRRLRVPYVTGLVLAGGAIAELLPISKYIPNLFRSKLN